MEEEVGIKVTRLRRRLSVESDDVKSPSTQSTPTKKRGGRLAAKPQLELIDENATEAALKRTRKSTSRDIAEPVEEKVLTPARRSTRIRSNTSIVSESAVDTAEDKGTPSRRSTRIKSNTSIIAETVQNVNSPRAKRAARRTSQVGSDNEAPVTPARQTRKTRKDSTSSVDKQAEPNAGTLGIQVKEVIVEESENSTKESKITENSKSDSPSLRKSPRLVGKTGRKSTSLENDDKENKPQTGKEADEKTNDADKSVSETKADQANEAVEHNASEQNNLSVGSSNLIKELDEAPKKSQNNLNKSTTAVAESQIKSKRNRTKSWTTISIEPSNEPSFCSDTEATRKKKKSNTLNLSNLSGSGDVIINISNKKEQEQDKNPSLNSSISDKKNKKRHQKSMTLDTESSVPEDSVLNTSVNLNKSGAEISDGQRVNKNVSGKVDSLNSPKIHTSNMTEKLLEQAPSGLIESLVYIEDSDSNNSNGKGNIDKGFDSGDQCVPVVDHDLGDETSKEPKHNLSYEPMDIDETMPGNVSLTTFEEKGNSISHIDKERKSSFNISQDKDDSINKSKRKSTISEMVTEETVNEGSNKSQRKSSISDIADNAIVDKDSNKATRKSSISNVVSEDTTDGVSDISMDRKLNKSKRKSSISNVESENKMDESSNMSFKKSSIPNTNNDDGMDKGFNKSKRKSSNIVSDSTNDKSKNKSLLTDLVDEENMDKSLNKSKKKSSISAIVAEVSMDNRKSISNPSNNDDDIINKSSNKSKRKSSITNNDESLDKGSNKSKRKSSVSAYLDKTESENKSTLVLSQIKDITESEINSESNLPKDSNESNEKLSKSVNVPNVETEKQSDKKNLSLTYLTSTPLQQKSLKKLGMQINSSIISPNNVSKIETKNTLNRSKKEASILSEENDSDSSEENEDSEEESLEKSKLIDDEAEEASDDYESGDSRDEEEKEYEVQHEIVDKGETLESVDENEYSDDSDYEKGSFIVTSDDEDENLLSGSGDDLSLSAEELSMSAKSKKKYNERKIKEQKKASREMFEARHKLNESDKSPKSKKNNRQRFDTSSSDSEEEVSAQPKKNKRQRIDSSQDISMGQSDADKSLSKKKQKAKRLSESDDATNEKEITIREENQPDKIDPLALQNVIKEEPKTPQKNLNISTVAITDMEDVEEVDIDENKSIMKSNQTSDPLQATIAQDDASEDNDDDEGSISENEEITNNYESVLSNLNKANSNKIKSSDISLNLNKKTKQKAKEPIIDELNLTQVKKSKKKKDEAAGSKKLDKSLTNKSTDKVGKQVNVFSEGSSDSIDMKLLFPEDSNDSEVLIVKTNNSGKKQEVNEINQKDGVDVPEDFIPLKRTEGKTNILENMDTANKSKDESILNVSNKKKNKRKSAQTEQAATMNVQENESVSFFIDTTGTHLDTNNTDANISIKNSAKKNKQKNNASFANEEATVDDNSNDAPLEVSYRSEKNKNKSIQDLNNSKNKEAQLGEVTVEIPTQSGKKKNKKGLNNSQNVTELSMIGNAEDAVVKSINTSAVNVDGSAKKKKKKMSESQTEQITENDANAPAEFIQNVSLGSAKKQKKKTISESSALEPKNVNKDDKDVINDEEISKKRKRSSSANQTIDEIVVEDDVKLNTSKTLNVSLTTVNQKKKRKISHNDEDVQAQVQDSDTETQEQEKAPVKIAKKKNKVQQHQEVDEIDDETAKKNKKRKERDDDDASKISKVPKQNSLDKVHVPRLPANVLIQLNDKPKNDIVETKKPKVISTTSFMVEESRKRRNKPSNYLEESVYLNDDLEERKQKGSIKNPKVLPFIPTASTSDNGFTTNFRVNIIPQHTQFVAQSNDVSNFKNDYLQKKRIKKLGTFEMYKRQRNIKISKF